MDEKLKKLFENFHPDILPVHKAPGKAVLEAEARRNNKKVEDIINEEAAKRYKTLDVKTGDVWLIQNPATWLLDENKFYRRKISKLGNLFNAEAATTFEEVL